MYDNVMTSVWISDRDTNNFLISIRLHQGLVLSLFIYFDDRWCHKRHKMLYSLVYPFCRWCYYGGCE
jgi:hypothetical protein